MAPTLAALRAPPPQLLQPNDEVLLINACPHGLVYVPNRHASNGMQALGKLYCLWFDAARRPYRFGGSLPSKYRRGGAADLATRWQERFAHRDGAEATEIAARRKAVQQMADLLRDNLGAMKNREYPTADLFLHTLHDRILSQFIVSSPEPLTVDELCEASTAIYDNVLSDCYAELMRCNTSHAAQNREMWPVLDEEHGQLRIDQKIALYVDNRKRSGDPLRSQVLDHAPWYPKMSQKKPPGRMERSVARHLRVKREPVRHEAVRRAFAGLVLGANYWNERLQRSPAVSAAEVAAKTSDWPAAYAAYNEAVRTRALTALAERILVKDPALQAQLDAQRAAQAAILRATPTFPVFADAPWRVQPDEVEKLRDQHFTVFKAVPKPNARPMEGNCNSGVFFLLRQAALEQQRMEGGDTPPVLQGGHGWRTFGAVTAINIPRADVLPDAPSFT